MQVCGKEEEERFQPRSLRARPRSSSFSEGRVNPTDRRLSDHWSTGGRTGCVDVGDRSSDESLESCGCSF